MEFLILLERLLENCWFVVGKGERPQLVIQLTNGSDLMNYVEL